MEWVSALSDTARLSDALEALEGAVARLSGPPDLMLLFVSPHVRGRAVELCERLRERCGPKVLLGCTAAGVIGAGREVELQPAVSMLAATLPGVEVTPLRVEAEAMPSPDDGPGRWVELLGVPQAPTPHFMLLCDPASSDPGRLLEGIDFAYAQSKTVGGLASDGPTNLLFLDGDVLDGGTVGVALAGNVVLDPVVAQGCRPVGPSLRITACQHNLLIELEGRRPTEVLEELFHDISREEARLLDRSLHLGIAATSLIDEDQEPEYLVRNVLGADPRRGILAIGSLLRPGQRVRFHLRDAAAASADLEAMLARYRSEASVQPAGAVLFSCTGRGRHLYGEPDHDSRVFAQAVGPEVPLGGFFCAGEIGPVGGDTCLLGYTSSFGLFRPLDAS
ncbi:MAG: FIST N-terminal domain-containing protein [Planctomycetota bacterium]